MRLRSQRPAPLTLAYGTDPSQVADLHLPAEGNADGAPWPVVVVIHGGYWGAGYGRSLGTGLAADVAKHGVAAWNIEYRRVGNGGGFPSTLLDVARAIDALAAIADPAADGRLDLERVVTVGHSAGGQLATWLAGRHKLAADAPGAQPAVHVRGVVAQAGVLDLVQGAAVGLGGGAVVRFLGGTPAEVPERYAVASPYELRPIGVPSTLIHGIKDKVVPIDQSDRYAAAAIAAGDTVDLQRLKGVDHFAPIDPRMRAWVACRTAALDYLM
ncbi:MAG TPA: alpha/beta hydrolase [Acidothermaceae bacterium]